MNHNGRTDTGDTIVYEFTVTNTGTTRLTSIEVVDDKLAAAGVDVTCPKDALVPGASMVCESDPYTVTKADLDHGSVDNVATVKGHTTSGKPVTSDHSTAIVTTPKNPGDLPNTGAGFTWWMPLAGLGLLGVGFGLILAKPRRRERRV